jgi:hypothetical protein
MVTCPLLPFTFLCAQVDVINRGLAGYNSRWALKAFNQLLAEVAASGGGKQVNTRSSLNNITGCTVMHVACWPTAELRSLDARFSSSSSEFPRPRLLTKLVTGYIWGLLRGCSSEKQDFPKTILQLKLNIKFRLLFHIAFFLQNT